MYITYTADLHHTNLMAIWQQDSAVSSVRPRAWNINTTVYFIFPHLTSWFSPSQSQLKVVSLGFDVVAQSAISETCGINFF